MLALYAPARASAQEAGDVGTNYGEFFGEAGGTSETPAPQGPHSLAEAKKQGRGFTLGASGSLYRKPDRDVHVVQQGDTLWGISDRYFGDPWHWPALWSYNPEITNPHWIYPLDQVRLSSATLSADEAAAAKAAADAQTEQNGTSTVDGRPPTVVEPKQESASELAPRVTVSMKLMKPETVFLRDEGYLDDDDIRSAGQIIGGNEEQMFLSPADEVYVKFKPGQDVHTGLSYTAYREPEKTWERDPDEKGTLVKLLGTILVRSYDREHGIARGVVSEAMEPIERGVPVTMLERRFDLVPPRRNAKNVVAHIIAAVQPRHLLSFGNVVFLDVGAGHGIEPGNRFFAVRRGDAWLDALQRPAREYGNIADVPATKKEDLPKEVVAELRVIKVRRKTTVALVTRSDTDIFQGEMVEMRQGF
jgi:hypothetical protein